jgi:hypothetical protein
MATALVRALELASKIENFPLGHCNPSDDPDMQWAYLTDFIDLVRPFIAAVKRIGDPDASEMLAPFETSPEHIALAYEYKANLQGVIDYLREASSDPTYAGTVRVNNCFVNEVTLRELRTKTSASFDLRKLVRFCEELNDCYSRANYLASVLLIRAIMNHVPPIFNCRTFGEVTAQAGKSLKAIFERLEDSARPIADLHTHALIRKQEILPTKHQVEPYKASFELLIQEVLVRL